MAHVGKGEREGRWEDRYPTKLLVCGGAGLQDRLLLQIRGAIDS